MKIRYVNVFLAYLCTLGVVGCVSSRQGNNKVFVDNVDVLTPDSMSSVNVDVLINVPEKAFSKRNRLIIVPQLMELDSVLFECTPLVLDAPIYRKKMERNKEILGYVDTLASSAMEIDRRKSYEIPYKERISVPSGLKGGRIIAVLSSDGCGECGVVDTLDMVHITNIPALIEPKKAMVLNWMEPEFVVRPKVMEGKGEALLQFLINRYDIKLDLGNNNTEMNRMLATLKSIVTDSLATLNSVDIYGMASADGSYRFNTTLALNRANSAKSWLIEQLNLDLDSRRKFSTGSRPEGWLPVLKAMVADGHPDSIKVREILDKYNDENDDVAERYIRRLKCWDDIRERYLQKDRKVEYVYTYTMKSFTTDEELLYMYGKRPDAFNEEELLRVSTLKKDHEEKKKVYRTILHYYPQSQVAANNLAVLLLREGKVDEAEVVINSLEDYSAEALNTKAAVYVYKDDYERAVELLQEYNELPEAKYNLALLKAKERKLEEAYQLIKDYEDANSAIIALSTNRNEVAYRMMSYCKTETSLDSYVRALIAARMKDCNKVCWYLKKAISDDKLKKRINTEPDFMQCSNMPEFKELTGGENGK